MTKSHFKGLMALAAIVVFAATSQAIPQQPPAERSPDLAKGVQDLNRSVQEIASLLREQLRKQDADLLMKRLEVSARYLSSREQDLRGADGERRGLSTELKMVQMRLEQLTGEIELQERSGDRKPEADQVRQKSELELRERLMKDSLVAADQKLSDLENDVAKLREEVSGWQRQVDSQLGLR